jgi:hypothetical protein
MMPRGRVLFVPAAGEGCLMFLGQQVPIQAADVAGDARRPGTRVRFDLVWENDDLMARHVRRVRGMWPPKPRDPADGPKVSLGEGHSALPATGGGASIALGSER